jgi:hypothetical protein
MGAGPDWAKQIAVADKVSIIELSMMLATLFLDIWMMLTHMPGPDMRDTLGWTSSILHIAKQRHPEMWEASQRPESDSSDAGQ